ncbi:MAG: hypothetical protein H2174_02930 [Vampirovibrio sp.]|nr:hypothetical protein [Vampirovibrio sp.]
MPRKTNEPKGDTFEQQTSKTKQPVDDNKGLLIATGIGTLVLGTGLLFAWLWATNNKKGKPLLNGTTTESSSLAGGSVAGSGGGTGKTLNATELRTELENQLTTIKANAEAWLDQQKQAVADIKNRPLNTAKTNIDAFLKRLADEFNNQKANLESIYRDDYSQFDDFIMYLKAVATKLVYNEDDLQAQSQEIEQLVTQALKEIKGVANRSSLISENTIIPTKFEHSKLKLDSSDKDTQTVLDDLNTQLDQFYRTFLTKMIHFNANALANSEPQILKSDLDKKIDQLVKQSEIYNLHKALYESIYPSA